VSLIVTSTSEVYGTAQYVPIDEKHPMQAQSPYAATKVAADKLTEAFYKSFNLPVITARPFNAYGPRQSARAIIPTVMTQLLSGEKEIKIGSIHPTRDFNYVRDICDGFIALAKCKEAIGKEINISNGKDISIGELTQTLIDVINPEAKIVTDENRVRPERSEVTRLLGDNTLISKLTGWKPEVSLRDGIKMTVEWFKNTENLSRYKWDIYNL
jgi:nucleoside-diphosphate-sugar epimerase